MLEIEQVQKLAASVRYRSGAIPDGKALVVATGASNMDLVVAQDLTVAYLAAENLNHLFRVLETVVLRIKRPQAIVTLETAAGGDPSPRAAARQPAPSRARLGNIKERRGGLTAPPLLLSWFWGVRLAYARGAGSVFDPPPNVPGGSALRRPAPWPEAGVCAPK